MNVRVVVRRGNGYLCSCCRQTWNDDQEFGTLEEAIDFANKTTALSRSEFFVGGTRADVYVVEIIKTEKVEFTPDEEEIKKFMAEYESEKTKSDKENEEVSEAVEREHLKGLLEKYPDMKGLNNE